MRFGRAAPAALLLAALVFTGSPDVQAQQPAAPQRPGTAATQPAAKPGPPPLTDEQALKGSLDIRLAYIITGDKEVDDISKAGLEGLSEILRNRTSVEPADPVGLDLERDEPRLYPLIYWPVTSTQPALSPRAQAALDRYLRTGGIIFIDTRDQQMSFDRPAGGNPDLKRLLAGVETPPLVAMPPDHVLSKAFYLLSDMPGRWQGGKLWIESGNGRVNDGVTTILIGSNDYAGAWAADQRGRGLLPVSPGGETQREMSYRFGVNLVMHALTGNYKDDQVHLPDIMQRSEAMNMTSAVSVAFDPLLPWTVLAVLGAHRPRAGAARPARRRARHDLAAGLARRRAGGARQSVPDRGAAQAHRRRGAGRGRRQRFAWRSASGAQQVQAAREALKRKLGQQEGLEVREVVLPPSQIQLGSERPGGTRLIDAMRSALIEIPPERLAGVVLLSDGQVHDVPAGVPPELGGAPVHALIAGKKNERDRLIVLEQSPRFGVVGREVTTKFRIEDPAGGTAPVTLSVGGEVVKRIDVPVGRSVELPITVGNPGANVVELEVGPGQNELTLDNNRALFTINGVRDRLRVLLVSGEPYQGERAWRNLLKSDPAVDLVHFTILRTPQKDDFTPVRELSLIVFPMRELFEQKLKEFDLIIFDRYESGNLITRDYFRNITEYVKGGGALLVSVGPVFATQRSLYRTPLGAILPARADRRRGGNRLQAQGHRDRPAPSGDGEPAAGRRPQQGAGVGPLVPPASPRAPSAAMPCWPAPRRSRW